MIRIGFIDYYLDEWHANNYPRMLDAASNGEIQVVCAYGMIEKPEEPKGRISTDEWCAKMGIPRANTIEEVIEKSDALVVLSPDNCEMHEKLCQLPLASGKPTYVDKTFAPDGEIARRIFAIADKSGTPCYSTSALRFANEYADIDPNTVFSVSSWGPNGFETYSIHQLEPIMMLIKSRPVRVMAQKCQSCMQLSIEFADGRIASLNCSGGDTPFMMNIATTAGNKVINVQSDYFGNFIKELASFFKTGEVKVPHTETIAIMDVRGAGVKALANPGIWVNI